MGLAIKTKVVTVTTSGTAVPVLAPGDLQDNIISVFIQAQTNVIYVGDNTVSKTGPVGHKLAAATNDTIKLDSAGSHGGGYDLAKVYLDASVDGSKANITYFRRV